MDRERETQPVPAQDCDILQGIEQIAAWRGLSVGQARHLQQRGLIPTYRLPGCSTIFAYKSEMIEVARRKLKAI